MKDLFFEMDQLKEITDHIQLRNTHKAIIDEVLNNQDTLIATGTSEKFQLFLTESFQILVDDDLYYERCVKILQAISDNIKLGYFGEFIDDLCRKENYRAIGYELLSKLRCKRKESYTEPCKDMKRVKRVSFKTEPEVRYIEKEINEESVHRNYRDEAHNEYQKIYSAKFEEKTKEIDWYPPEMIDNVPLINRDTEEEAYQRERESGRSKFTNNKISHKYIPDDLSNKKENAVVDAPKEIPLIDLKVQNTWKKMDFIKIVKNKDVDLRRILEDPSLVKRFL